MHTFDTSAVQQGILSEHWTLFADSSLSTDVILK